MRGISRFLLCMAVAAVACCTIGIPNAETKPATNFKQTGYLDLTVDPCNPNGLSPVEKAALISSGYIDSILAADAYFEGVKFKTSGGVFYYRNGWVHAGTEFLFNPIDPNKGGTFAVCSNVYTYWRWQV